MSPLPGKLQLVAQPVIRVLKAAASFEPEPASLHGAVAVERSVGGPRSFACGGDAVRWRV